MQFWILGRFPRQALSQTYLFSDDEMHFFGRGKTPHLNPIVFLEYTLKGNIAEGFCGPWCCHFGDSTGDRTEFQVCECKGSRQLIWKLYWEHRHKARHKYADHTYNYIYMHLYEFIIYFIGILIKNISFIWHLYGGRKACSGREKPREKP